MSTTTYKKKEDELLQPQNTVTTYVPASVKEAEENLIKNNTQKNNTVQTNIPNIVPDSKAVDYSLGQQAAAKSFSYNGTKPTYASPYSAQIDQLFNEIQNAPDFSYDPSTDKSYQALRGQYTNLGQRAMKDTAAHMAAQTGGMASSYAASAGAQAYNNYMSQLAGFIPELQQLAYEMYQEDLNNKYQQLNALNVLENNAYGRYRDDLSDYYTEYNNAYNQYLNEQAQSNWQAQFDYQKQQDLQNHQDYLNEIEYQKQQDLLAQENFLKQFEYQKTLDELKQQNYLNEVAYQKLQDELAQQNWREQFDYQKTLDELKQQNYINEFEYQKLQDALAQENWQKQFDSNEYWNQVAQENWQKQFDSNEYWNSVSQSNWASEMAYKQQLAAMEQANWQKQFDYNAQQDSLAQQNYLNELAYQQYLDSLEQQNYENEFAYEQYLQEQKQQNYLNELEYQRQQDALANQRYDNEFAYEQYLNSLAQQNYQNEFAYNQYLNSLEQSNYEKEMTYKQEQDALDRAWEEALTKVQFGDTSGLSNLGVDLSNYGTTAGVEADDFDPYSKESIGTIVNDIVLSPVDNSPKLPTAGLLPSATSPVPKSVMASVLGEDPDTMMTMKSKESALESAKTALRANKIDSYQYGLVVDQIKKLYEDEEKALLY